jgi:predicted ATP-dependent endonuclease of OLD family
LHFFIYDDDEVTPFKPSQRSKGLQWFLSFFLTLNSESNDNSIILIDEPGLFLHAKAQEDVLKVLENIATKQQVMFTTHSPYLIDANRLDRIRLAIKDKNNHTKIENKIHKGADKNTMTPIITAVGLDITKTLSFSPTSNILLEGMSDYYYLQAMRKYLGAKCVIGIDVQFIPNVGADQIPNMAALLFGWGVDFKVLLDNDTKGSSVANKLMNNLFLDKDKVVLIDTGKNHAIEDVFTNKDFCKYVLEKEIDGSEELNSKKVKGLDKILLAKKLCSRIHGKDEQIKFEKKTVDNFIKLFEKLA